MDVFLWFWLLSNEVRILKLGRIYVVVCGKILDESVELKKLFLK